MAKKIRIKERIIEGLIYISGTSTTIAVLLIVFFIFKEGSGLFFMPPLEEGYVIAIHPQNPVKELSEKEIKSIFNKDIVNWKDLNGKPEKILTFVPDDIELVFKPEDLGTDFVLLKDKMETYALSNPNIILAMPERYVGNSLKRIPIDKIGLGSFLFDKDWFPTSIPLHSFGIWAIILGTLWVCVGALLFAIPAGIIAAIYMAEIANPRFRNIISPFIELLAGIPSVIYGFFGLVVIVPMIQRTFQLPAGETALAGSILLGIIALPTIITIAEDAIRATPRELKEASFALGATHWQTIYKVVVPYSISGIVSACILGVGRTVGETMAVLMVTGNAAQVPNSFLSSVRTITATVAAELGEAPQGGIHYKALFMLASILFIITFLLNLVADRIASRSARK